MKVLHVIETLGHGGAEQLLVTLLPELNRQGIETSVVVRRAPFALRGALEAEGVPVTILEDVHKWNLASSAKQISKISRAMGADIIHAHMYFPAVSTALARAMAITSVKTCVTFHNLAYAGANRNSLRLCGKRYLAGFVYPRGMCGYFAVSQAVADHYSQALDLRKISVVHNGIDMTELDALPQVQRADVGKVHIVVPGRLVPEKGHVDLLDALRGLPDNISPYSVTFVGGGPQRGALENMVREYGLSEHITFTGALDHTSFLKAISSADLVVIPSRFEGFGLVALEAMALGRPVLASTAGGLPEVVADAGLLVPPANPIALREAFLRILSDRDFREKLGTAGYKRSRSKFTISAMAEKLIKLYQELPSKPARGKIT